MARRDLLQPLAYQTQRRQLARDRREAFVDPPLRRNRVWQFDFSEFETSAEGHLAAGRDRRLLGQDGPGMSDLRDQDRL